MKFYLGTHRPNWLADTEICDRRIPLFISRKTLANKRDGRIASRITLPRARTSWVLDSGGFSELSQYGRWTIGPVSYVAEVRRCRDEIGMLEWAAPQDWMTENHILDKTGLTLRAHQNRTVRNYLTLREIASDLPFVPVIQGQTLDDYRRCVDIYNKAGVDLSQQSIVGIGSVCRRQATREIELIVTALAEDGLRLHGFGVKTGGFTRYAKSLVSADSMAWSRRGRRTKPGCSSTHLNEANCKRFALTWYDHVILNLEGEVTDEIGQRWYPQPNDLIGGWCVMLTDLPPSHGGAMVADFTSEQAARHVAALHNAWLRSGSISEKS